MMNISPIQSSENNQQRRKGIGLKGAKGEQAGKAAGGETRGK